MPSKPPPNSGLDETQSHGTIDPATPIQLPSRPGSEGAQVEPGGRPSDTKADGSGSDSSSGATGKASSASGVHAQAESRASSHGSSDVVGLPASQASADLKAGSGQGKTGRQKDASTRHETAESGGQKGGSTPVLSYACARAPNAVRILIQGVNEEQISVYVKSRVTEGLSPRASILRACSRAAQLGDHDKALAAQLIEALPECAAALDLARADEMAGETLGRTERRKIVAKIARDPAPHEKRGYADQLAAVKLDAELAGDLTRDGSNGAGGNTLNVGLFFFGGSQAPAPAPAAQVAQDGASPGPEAQREPQSAGPSDAVDV